jgi:cytosine/adenosine deaminase-related metal-dependent hydrolase
MIELRAAWIVPIASPPIRDGWVAVDRNRIVALGKVGTRARTADSGATRTIDLGARAILPGLVNAHAHLELSWMRGRIPPADHLPAWIRALMTLRGAEPDAAERAAAMRAAVAEAVQFGTSLVGDVGNTLDAFEPLSSSPLAAVMFHELIAFSPPDAAAPVRRARAKLDALPARSGLRAAIAPHAPYSVAPSLFRAIRADLDAHPFARTTVHLAESRDELEFLRCGTGAWRALLEDVGAWTAEWKPPACGPVEYLDRLRFLDERVLVVHGVHLTAPELERARQAGATIVTCPRGNIRSGAGTPPVQAFYDAGVRVAVGTDSLAGVDDLNLFAELAAMRTLAPRVPASRLLESATRIGAEALGFGGELGSIEPGRRARLLAVDVPSSETDVEEYLLGGIGAGQIGWIESGAKD